MYINKFGDKAYINSKGKLHKEDGPAYENTKGTKSWYKENYLHRIDSPAIEKAKFMDITNMNKFRFNEYRNSKGELHRLDGPACEKINGIKIWCKENKYHRLDGPAIEDSNKYWFILDKFLKEKEFNSWIIRILKFIWIKQKCI